MDLSSRVFVIQRQQRWDIVKQQLVDKFDLTPARVHGDLIFLLSPSASPFNPTSTIKDLRLGLSSFNPDRDCLLLIGNPCLIGFAVSLAAERSENGKVFLLQWSGKDHRYIRVEAVLYPEGEQ